MVERNKALAAKSVALATGAAILALKTPELFAAQQTATLSVQNSSEIVTPGCDYIWRVTINTGGAPTKEVLSRLSFHTFGGWEVKSVLSNGPYPIKGDKNNSFSGEYEINDRSNNINTDVNANTTLRELLVRYNGIIGLREGGVTSINVYLNESDPNDPLNSKVVKRDPVTGEDVVMPLTVSNDSVEHRSTMACPSPTASPTSTSSATATSTETQTPIDTSTSTPTSINSATSTNTPTTSSTNTSTPTSSATPSETPRPINTSTSTPTPSQTVIVFIPGTATPTYTRTPEIIVTTVTPTPKNKHQSFIPGLLNGSKN